MLAFKKVLRLEDEGPEVLDVKQFLISHGFNQVYMQGGQGKPYPAELKMNDYYSEVLQEVINNWKAKVIGMANALHVPDWARENWDIQVDGIVDYNTWLIMENYDKLLEHYGVSISPDVIVIEPSEPSESVRERFIKEFIKIAKLEVGVHEVGQSNTGKRVDEYQNRGSNGAFRNGGNPWCFFFLQWCWLTVCDFLHLEYKDHYYGYTPDGVNWGKEKGICKGGKSGGGHVKIEDCQPGDLGFIYSSSRDNACHIFLIAQVKKDSVITIEGNTNTAGSRDGGSVAIRERPISQVWATVRMADLY